MSKRTVLAPSEDTHPKVDVKKYDDGKVCLGYWSDEDTCNKMFLTEPEALALRDWLCEQFGLPACKQCAEADRAYDDGRRAGLDDAATLASDWHPCINDLDDPCEFVELAEAIRALKDDGTIVPNIPSESSKPEGSNT